MLHEEKQIPQLEVLPMEEYQVHGRFRVAVKQRDGRTEHHNTIIHQVLSTLTLVTNSWRH